MRVIALLLVCMLPLAAAELKIDHATICGTNLAEMRKSIGMPTEYGGPHSNHATEMALVSFPDGSYLELMGIQAKADPAAVAAHEWSPFLRNNAGPCAFALRVSNIGVEVRKLKSAGIETGNPETGGRTRPDGTKLVWRTVSVGPGKRGSLFPFLISDRTPREKRSYPSGKATTDLYGGIARAVVGVHDLDDAIARYRNAFHLAAPLRQENRNFGADLAWFEGTPFVLARGIGAASWLNRRVSEYGDAPVAFVLKHGKTRHQESRSNWFGHDVHWIGGSQTGWRLGAF